MSESLGPAVDSNGVFPGTSSAVVMFVISKSYKAGVSEADLYDMTRGNWRIGEKSRNAARIALGISDGIIRSAYVVDYWGNSTERYAPDVAKGFEGRSYFSGKRSNESDKWIGLSVRHLAPAQGAANPVRLFLTGVPPSVQQSRVTFAQLLAQEPLAQIMFGNKELFHSNVLAWIFNTFPEEADQVFGSFVEQGVGNGQRRVERERENLDLVFHWPDKGTLVIENKVFSVPDSDQLDKYAEKVSKWDTAPSNMLLLSPTRSAFIKDGYQTPYTHSSGSRLTWGHLSFEQLAELFQIAFDGEASNYEVETVHRYATVLLALGRLVESTRVADLGEPVFSPTGDVDPFLTKQMISSLSKARAERVAEGVNLFLAGHGQATMAYSHFSNAQPGVSCFFDVQREQNEFSAGCQYQGGTFRLALVLPHLAGKGLDSKNTRAAFAQNHPEYFSFDHLDPILDSAGVKMSDNKQGKSDGDFNHFDPDFLYRYKKLPNLTVEQVRQAALAHAHHLAEWSD